MTKDTSPSLLHRAALAAIGLALVTLTFGALVTSQNAGMAFADWPTSDGYLMVTYPWLRDFARDWDKFLEHGHRLAGMLIGIWSIALVVIAWRTETRRWVRWLAASVLLGVICQGLLGGFRVQLNERGLAMLHGIFAAVVFSLMGTLSVVTSRNWRQPQPVADAGRLAAARWTATAMLVTAFGQYILGSLIRHQGTALHEHRGLGVVIGALSFVLLVQSWRSGHPWLRRAGIAVVVTILAQVGLGFAAWFSKYGIPSLGYVATADSIGQVSLRTGHMVWGTITLLSLVAYALKLGRVAACSPQLAIAPLVIRPADAASLTAGGAAT